MYVRTRGLSHLSPLSFYFSSFSCSFILMLPLLGSATSIITSVLFSLSLTRQPGTSGYSWQFPRPRQLPSCCFHLDLQPHLLGYGLIWDRWIVGRIVVAVVYISLLFSTVVKVATVCSAVFTSFNTFRSIGNRLHRVQTSTLTMIFDLRSAALVLSSKGLVQRAWYPPPCHSICTVSLKSLWSSVKADVRETICL